MTQRHNSPDINQTDHSSLPTPLFDANASATAQPVERIRRSRTPSWMKKLDSINLKEKFHSISGRINGQSRMLAVVILIGLITGTLAGMLLVNIARSGPPATTLDVPVNQPASEMPVTQAQKLDTFAAELGGGDGQTASPTITRNRNPRRVRMSRPRAYRVAVIR